MRLLGVPAEWIGMKGVPGVGEGSLTRYPAAQGGGNLRPDHPNVISGRWQAGINVDEAAFDPNFQAIVGGYSSRFITSEEAIHDFQALWAVATVGDRLDAVIAHELAEMSAEIDEPLREAYGLAWPHFAALRAAPETALTVSDTARELLRLQRVAFGLA